MNLLIVCINIYYGTWASDAFIYSCYILGLFDYPNSFIEIFCKPTFIPILLESYTLLNHTHGVSYCVGTSKDNILKNLMAPNVVKFI
jgi:hypothetical protein